MKYLLSILSLFLFLAFATAVDPHPAAQQHPDDVEKEIDDLIRSHPLMVFSKTYCPYSKRAKKLLGETLGAKNMEVLEINNRDDTDKILEYLHSKSGRRTVPQIFVNGKFVGGSDDIAKMQKKGTLRPMLVKAKVL